jgi:hypothetical protein
MTDLGLSTDSQRIITTDSGLSGACARDNTATMSYPPPQDPWGQQPPAARGNNAATRPYQPRRPGNWFGRLGPARQVGISVLGIFVLACCGVSTLVALLPGGGSDPDRKPAAATSARQTTPPAVATTAPEPVVTTPAPRPTTPAGKAPPKPKPVYYGSCTAVRNAGRAPLREGQPGYRAALDRDGDGRACESAEGPAPGTEEEPDDGDDGGPSSVYYKNCAAVRAAGADPIRRGDPGYGRHLDRDGDGVGCE